MSSTHKEGAADASTLSKPTVDSSRAATDAPAAKTSLQRVLAACFLGLAVSGAPIFIYTQSVFLAPMTQEFGWSRSTYFLPLSIGGLLAAVATVAVGGLADRQGVRRWLLAGITTFCLLNFALAAMTGAVWQYMLIVVAMIVVASAHGPLLYTKALSEWSTSRPGLIIALALCGTAVGAIFTPPLATWLVEEWGWRVARAALAGLVLLIAAPMVWLFVWPPPPELRSHSVDQTLHAEGSLTLRQALATRRYIQLLAGAFAGAFALNALLANMTQLITDRGLPPAVAASALSGFALAGIFGRLLAGAALDRVRTSRIGALWFLMALPGVLLVGYAPSAPAVVAGAMLLGLALGSELELGAYYTLRFFGVKHYGNIYGMLMAVFTVGATTGPLALGFAFDRTGNNDAGLYVTLGALAFVVVAFFTLGPYRFALPGHNAMATPDKAG